jgi:ABC-2 type transport system permease protein
MNIRRLRAIARKECLHILRDWRSLLLALAIPIFLILLFGYALDTDLKNVPTIAWDQSNTPQSREFLSFFGGSPTFSLDRFADNYRDIRTMLDEGRAMVAVVVPPDFADNIEAGRVAPVQVIVDGCDANRARLAIAYASTIGELYNRNIAARRTTLQSNVPVELDTRAWYNPDLRSANVIIPGIIALVMVVIASMLTSVTVAREWETGTMEQLIATPVRPTELLWGKVAPYFLIGMIDVLIAVATGMWLFDVPFRGSLVLLVLLSGLFLIGTLFFGLMISAAMKRQTLANQIALTTSYLPTLMLSGFTFAIANMPYPIQILTYIVPGRYFVTILRGIYLKGVGLEVLWESAAFLLVFAVMTIRGAHKKMRLKLE